MSTDHRGRPLASQGGAIPHLNRRLYDFNDEDFNDEDTLRALMEDSGGVGLHTPAGVIDYPSEPESQSSWNWGNAPRARRMKDM